MLESSERWESLWRKCPHQTGLGWAWVHFLIDDWWEMDQPFVGGATPRQVVLGAVRKQAGEALRTKPVSSVPLAPQLLPPGSSPNFPQRWTRRWNNPFLPASILAMVFYHSNKNSDPPASVSRSFSFLSVHLPYVFSKTIICL